MDAYELMLGDWAYFKVGDFWRAVKITRLSDGLVECNNKFSTTPSRLSGIPLSEELAVEDICNSKALKIAIDGFECKYVHELQHFLRLAKIKRDLVF